MSKARDIVNNLDLGPIFGRGGLSLDEVESQLRALVDEVIGEDWREYPGPNDAQYLIEMEGVNYEKKQQRQRADELFGEASGKAEGGV